MKKIISIILCLSLICSIPLSVSAAGEQNAPSSWAEGYVDKAESMNIYDSNSMGITYKKYIDRETYCNLAYRTLEQADAVGSITASADEMLFNDTKNEKVYALNKMGIIKGKGNGKFAPRDSLTREEAATILYRMICYAGCKKNNAEFDMAAYADDKEISDWAKAAVYEMLRIGIMNGTGKNFEPKGLYTGEQAITTMVRIMELISGSDPVEADGNTFADNMNSLMPQDKNYMFSPLSIKMALAMMANGASGETKDEILKATGITNLDAFNLKSQEMIENYNKLDVLKFNVANSMWINSSKTDQRFSADYESKLKKFYNAGTGIVTLDNAVETINKWVNDNTNGKISKLLTKDNAAFGSIILNAVYFSGKWEDEFYKGATKPDTFTDRNGSKSMIDFMNRTSWMRYANVDGVTVVELPYRKYQVTSGEDGYSFGNVQYLDGVDVSMFLLTSDGKKFNPEETVKKAEMSSEYVSLSVPKFRIEYEAGMNDMLNSLGIHKAFTDYAEFEKMYDKGNMSITDTLHKTYITVDEEGTEAAAVTGIISAGTAIPPKPITVKYDKPFTFVIMDKANGEVLFMGEYAFSQK